MIVLILALIKNLFPPSPREADRPPTFSLSSLSDWWYCSVNGNVCGVPLHLHKCSSGAVAEKTQGLTLLTLSSEAGEAAVEPVTVSSSSDSLGLLLQAGERGPLSKGQSWLTGTQASPWGPGPFPGGEEDEAGGWVSPFGEGELFTSEILKPRMLPAVVDITWSWRWSGFEVPDMHVGPLACCAWSSCFSLSDSSWLTSDKPTLNALSLQGGGDFSQLEFWTVH